MHSNESIIIIIIIKSKCLQKKTNPFSYRISNEGSAWIVRSYVSPQRSRKCAISYYQLAWLKSAINFHSSDNVFALCPQRALCLLEHLASVQMFDTSQPQSHFSFSFNSRVRSADSFSWDIGILILNIQEISYCLIFSLLWKTLIFFFTDSIRKLLQDIVDCSFRKWYKI